MTATFLGHKDLADTEHVRKWLQETVTTLIQRGVKQFLLGGYGSFDNLAARVVKDLQEDFPHIESYLVIPYIDRDFNKKLYDNSIYPPLETVPKRFAISKRNEWMIEESDVVVAYVLHGWGGAATTLEYAQRKQKEVIQYQRPTDGA